MLETRIRIRIMYIFLAGILCIILGDSVTGDWRIEQ